MVTKDFSLSVTVLLRVGFKKQCAKFNNVFTPLL